jgi:hypothetical protein
MNAAHHALLVLPSLALAARRVPTSTLAHAVDAMHSSLATRTCSFRGPRASVPDTATRVGHVAQPVVRLGALAVRPIPP